MAALAEACSGNEAIEKIRKNPFSVVILDISMPGKNGLDTLKEIKVIHPDLPVLILSMYPEEQYALRFFRAGASGYLTKKSAGRTGKRHQDSLKREKICQPCPG